MHPDVYQLVSPVLAILLLILLITRLRFHPFLALILSAGYIVINESFKNWQSVWTCAVYAGLAITMWRVRVGRSQE